MLISYDPTIVERSINEHNYDQQYTDVLLLPPPNVTGQLHMGHALTVAIQDTIVRHNRQIGRNTLYLPGTDHAGIATQTVADKLQMKIEEFAKMKSDIIYTQLNTLGASIDTSKSYFTLDEQRSHAVQEAFIRLYNDGLIYRAQRLVNWCSYLKTSISDIEVEWIELTGPTKLTVPGCERPVMFGQMYYVEFTPELTVATTRPETLYGDVALAVHPSDTRYQHLIGTTVMHPLLNIRIPIISDPLVDMNIGTGVLKITPCHDPLDEEIARKHSLLMEYAFTIFTEDGHIQNVPRFNGVHRYELRESIIRSPIIKDVKAHPMKLGLCSRTHDVIEPRSTSQWFLRTSEMSQKAVHAVRTGQLNIFPISHMSTWYNFLENEQRDWCISRQISWGHRIPIYYNETTMCVAKSKEEAIQKLGECTQDPDVLDTWFSSSLLPLSALGWPHKFDEQFYPMPLIETGYDILFFWVSRMVMMCTYFTGKIPFKTILLHGLVVDEDGQKMSKSKGNVVDPLDIIHGKRFETLMENIYQNMLISKSDAEKIVKQLYKKYPNGYQECGSDALRAWLVSKSHQTVKIPINMNEIISYRHFCNKLWQMVKFYQQFEHTIVDINETNDDVSYEHWIRYKFDRCVKVVNVYMTKYLFSDAIDEIHTFFVDYLASIYIEVIKPVAYNTNNVNRHKQLSLLRHCLINGLILLHPFMPFITSYLYKQITNEDITMCNYPSCLQTTYDLSFDAIVNIVKRVRQLLSKKPQSIKNKDCTLMITSNDVPDDELIYINTLSGIKSSSSTSKTFGNVPDSITDGEGLYIIY